MALAALVLPGLYDLHITHGLETTDAGAPTYTQTPAVSGLGATYVQVNGIGTDTNPPVTLYIVAVADAAGAPTAAQVAAGTDSADAPAPKGTASGASGALLTATIAGLSASTAYDVYYTMGDNFGNLVASAKLDITTPAAAAFDPNDTVRPIANSSRMVRPVANDIT